MKIKKILISLLCVMMLTGCETIKRVANTARNLKDIVVAGKIIKGVVK